MTGCCRCRKGASVPLISEEGPVFGTFDIHTRAF
jgi:hypothetical protein